VSEAYRHTRRPSTRLSSLMGNYPSLEKTAGWQLDESSQATRRGIGETSAFLASNHVRRAGGWY
jgi:hypothetical protein